MMMVLIGYHMLFAIWLALLACVGEGDTSTSNSMGYFVSSSSSSCYQTTCCLLNPTHLDTNNVSSIGTITTASSTACLEQTVINTMLTSPTDLQEAAQLDTPVQVPRGQCNSARTSFSALSLDGKLSHGLLEITNASSEIIPAFPFMY